MSAQKDLSSNELRITRLFPQWFKDLDSALKPVVSSLILLVVATPMVIWTIRSWHKAADLHDQLQLLLAKGGSTAELNRLTEQFESANSATQRGILLTAGVAWFGAMLIAYAIPQLSVGWLRDLTAKVRRAADGDLTTEILRDNKSQIGDIQETLGKMVGSFHATVERIGRASSELKDASVEMSGITDEAGSAIGEVAHSVSTISIGAGNQVDLIGATSSEVGSIEVAVRDAAEHAALVRDQSASTVELTEQGVLRAAEIEEAIIRVRDTGGEMAKVIHVLGKKSTDIDLMVQSIADIAEQTNLLALNAAIEAARAGEQGRGFAVVAEEVRKLAEEAQAATDEIAVMTAGVRECTDRAIEAVREGTPTVIRSIEAVELNRDAFAEISGAAASLNEATEQIATLAEGIADDAARVRAEIEDIASVAEESSASTEQVSAATQQSSASAEEVAAAASSVAGTAAELAGMVTEFKLDRTSRNVHRLVPRGAQEPVAPAAESTESAKEEATA